MAAILRVDSEIGDLQAVLLHRPGPELNNLIPRYLDDLLFDEIPWLDKAREEHEEFAKALQAAGQKCTMWKSGAGYYGGRLPK